MDRRSWKTRFDAIDPAWKFALGAYIVARVALTAWAFVIALIFPVMAQNVDVFGAPVLAVFDLTTSQRYAFSREIDGATLTLRMRDTESLIDLQTESVWSLRDGRAIAGRYAGQSFKPSAYSAEEIFPYRGVAPEQNWALALWQRFDVNWYLAIAQRGYGTIPGDTHFPPLYPALIRLVGAIIGNHFIAGIVISNAALILALGLFYQSARELIDNAIAARAVVFLLLFPTFFFCLTAYTEPVFLLAALLALRKIQQGAWAWAGFWIFCAILIRLQGIALIVPLIYALWLERRPGQNLARLWGLGLPALAMGVYLFTRYIVGDSAVVPIAETELHARLTFPWENYMYAIQTLASGKSNFTDVLNFVITTGCVLVLIGGWRKMPMNYNLYFAASLVVLTIRLVDTQPLNSMSRYAFTLFPMFIGLAMWAQNAWVQRAVVYASLLLMLYLSAQFFLWGWVA